MVSDLAKLLGSYLESCVGKDVLHFAAREPRRRSVAVIGFLPTRNVVGLLFRGLGTALYRNKPIPDEPTGKTCPDLSYQTELEHYEAQFCR